MGAIWENVPPGTRVYTDEYQSYSSVGAEYAHGRINHSANQYVNGMVHVNGVENFWSHLKRGLDGIYHWASPEHLQRYVDEFTLRYNTRKLETCRRFDLILANVAGRRMRYQDLIKNGKKNQSKGK